MKERKEEKLDRKEFLSNIIRAFILGILLIVPAFLISKKRVSAKNENCDLNIQCKNCSERRDCALLNDDYE